MGVGKKVRGAVACAGGICIIGGGIGGNTDDGGGRGK